MVNLRYDASLVVSTNIAVCSFFLGCRRTPGTIIASSGSSIFFFLKYVLYYNKVFTNDRSICLFTYLCKESARRWTTMTWKKQQESNNIKTD